MIHTGFESKVKVQQIIGNQLPEFVVNENPKALDFLKQYYISQEYQSGPVDLGENIDKYIRIDNLTKDVISGQVATASSITNIDDIITVDGTTKGFPQEWGLLKIGDEIVTYSGVND